MRYFAKLLIFHIHFNSLFFKSFTDVLAYSLSLEPPLFKLKAPILTIIEEAKKIGEGEDIRGGNMNRLKVVSMELLSAYYKNEENENKKNEILNIFFKAQFSNSKETANVAKKVLVGIETKNKEFLHQCLRPTLTNFSDIKKVNVQLLKGLKRLLKSLKDCFNATLGEKLLEYMKELTETTNNNDLSILTSMLDIFHLLPLQAVKFLNLLVNQCIKMENKFTKMSENSPFRKPLCKYLSRFASESYKYFLKNLNEPNISHLFLSILKMDIAAPLREALSKNVYDIILHTFSSSSSSNLYHAFQGFYFILFLFNYLQYIFYFFNFHFLSFNSFFHLFI